MRGKVELLRHVFDIDTPDAVVRTALAMILALDLPPASGQVVLKSPLGMAGYALGQSSVVNAIRETVSRVLADGSENGTPGACPSPGESA